MGFADGTNGLCCSVPQPLGDFSQLTSDAPEDVAYLETGIDPHVYQLIAVADPTGAWLTRFDIPSPHLGGAAMACLALTETATRDQLISLLAVTTPQGSGRDLRRVFSQNAAAHSVRGARAAPAGSTLFVGNHLAGASRSRQPREILLCLARS
jgi:hypothetical protein